MRNISAYNTGNLSDPEVETTRTVMLQTLTNPMRTNHRPTISLMPDDQTKTNHHQHNTLKPLGLQNDPAHQTNLSNRMTSATLPDNPENPGYKNEIFPGSNERNLTKHCSIIHAQKTMKTHKKRAGKTKQ